jgi:hypothetical protein
MDNLEDQESTETSQWEPQSLIHPELNVRSLFSKKKVKPSNASSLPPPPPVPAPRVIGEVHSTADDGWEREYQKLEQSLNKHGLAISKVDADGSCLFSAFALNLPGSSGASLRKLAVDYMIANPDDFAPFIDSEAYPDGFEDYCNRMRRHTTWGGQLEIQALSLALKVNVFVYQTGEKSTIKMINFEESSTQCVTVSYHDGEHYNAVISPTRDSLVTSAWLESVGTGSNGPEYTDKNPPISKVPRSRKKAGLFN